MPVEISVIVVSYNARELLGECLRSVLEDAAGEGAPSVELIVVDNDSGDGSAQWVRQDFPDVITIEAGRNGGMAAGNNVGMRAASGNAFLLLNSDARLRPGALRAMLRHLRDEDRVGLVAPRLLNADGSLQPSARGFPTVWRLATEFWYLRRAFPRVRLFNEFYKCAFTHDRVQAMEWVCGACMLVPRQAVDEVGLMNEAYFMFSEETDWQWRMHEHGWRVLFVPDAEVEHLGGGSTDKQWGRMYRAQVRSHLRFLATNVSIGSARHARVVLAGALALRTVAYRVASWVVPGARTQRALRANSFAQALDEVLNADVTELSTAVIPAWRPHGWPRPVEHGGIAGPIER